MKKNFLSTKFLLAGGLLLTLPTKIYAQSLGLQDAGQKLMTEVEGVFPYIAGIIFLFVGWKNLGNFTSENGDIWKGIKNLVFYILAVLIVVGVYRFVKTQTL